MAKYLFSNGPGTCLKEWPYIAGVPDGQTIATATTTTMTKLTTRKGQNQTAIKPKRGDLWPPQTWRRNVAGKMVIHENEKKK